MTDDHPEVFWFGGHEARCFGMLHRPAHPVGRGVVLCNALGFEGSLALRPLRDLARTLTAAGFTVLRFDYAGTGDSAGSDWEPARVKTWLTNIAEAVDLLRDREGVTDVQLAGFRIGATLAALASEHDADISGLALWAPLARGKSYARELRALARLSAAGRPVHQPVNPAFPGDSVEAVGYEFTATTLEELSAIDLRPGAATSPVPHVLVLDRDDIAPNDDLVEAYTVAGATVEHAEISGYQEFQTDDETTSRWPAEAIERLARWLTRPTTAPAAPTGTTHDVIVEDHLTIDEPGLDHLVERPAGSVRTLEHPAWVDDRLLAITTEPERSADRRGVTILVLNTGSNSRSGAGRLTVHLARHWAALGFTVVRVDLGGVGDSVASDPATENKPYAPVRLDEVATLLAWLRDTHPDNEISMFGMCSGGFNSFQSALRGAPVARIMLVNPLIFYAGEQLKPGESADHALLSANMLSRGLGSSARWKRLISGEQSVGDVIRRARALVSKGALRGLVHQWLTKLRNAVERMGIPVGRPTQIAQDLQRLGATGLDIVFIFSADEPGLRYLHNIGGNTVARLIDSGRIKLIEVAGGDHVISPPGARRSLIEATTRYLEQAHPAPSAHSDDPGHPSRSHPEGTTPPWTSN